MTHGHDVYQSPFSWRYGSDAMRRLWSEGHRRRLMRRVWLALAEAQHKLGVVSGEQLADLHRTADDIDMARAAAIEAEIQHDVMAEVRAWAEQAPVGGPIIHLGATSADITDNVDMLRIRAALDLVRGQLLDAIAVLADRVDETADVVTLGWTHIQPAAPTTVGYRLAGTLQDLLLDLAQLETVKLQLRGKGFKGPVGTGASYAAVLEGRAATAGDMEADAMRRLGMEPAPITSQVYPRKLDWLVLNVLAGIAASTSTLAYNMRVLQSPPFGEWIEGFGSSQVGSSSMPWKRNPINAENANSLARFVASLPTVAWMNEAANLLERTLDDSANRRIVLPEAFLATDEILLRLKRLATRLAIDEAALTRTLDRFGPFAASERVLLAASAAGGDRQALHERLRQHAMAAWSAVEQGEPNPLPELVASDEGITRYVDSDTVRQMLGAPEAHIGDAPERARAMADRGRQAAETRE